MPIPLIVKEALVIVGKQALIGGLTALGAFLLQRGVTSLEPQGVKLPIVIKDRKSPIIEIKK